MAAKQFDKALVLIDLINEMLDAKGKLAGKGYVNFLERHHSLAQVQQLLKIARRIEMPIFHVRLAFSPDYKEQPERSPLFGGAKKFSALQCGAWGTEFHPQVAPQGNEAEIIKHRVSGFYGTALDLILRTYGVKDIFVCGVATDMGVQTTARDGHDRDYNVTVIRDCCIAANDEDHEQTLRMIAKVCAVKPLSELELG